MTDFKKFCKECKNILKKNDITTHKQFLKWALKNHPDKGGNEDIFKIISNCDNEYFGTYAKCDYDSDYDSEDSEDSYYTKPKTKPKTSPKNKTSEKKPCREDQERNPKTGRCKKKTTAKSPKKSPKSPKGCGVGKIRNPKTGRCVSRTGKIGKEILKGKK